MKTNCENCEISRDYSGVKVRLNGICAVLVLASSLLGYSVIWQAPRIDRLILETKQEMQLKMAEFEARLRIVERTNGN